MQKITRKTRKHQLIKWNRLLAVLLVSVDPRRTGQGMVSPESVSSSIRPRRNACRNVDSTIDQIRGIDLQSRQDLKWVDVRGGDLPLPTLFQNRAFQSGHDPGLNWIATPFGQCTLVRWPIDLLQHHAVGQMVVGRPRQAEPLECRPSTVLHVHPRRVHVDQRNVRMYTLKPEGRR